MRKEPFFKNDFVHIYNRGNRKQEIVRDVGDREHFLSALYYLNSEKTPDYPFQDLHRTRCYKPPLLSFPINEQSSSVGLEAGKKAENLWPPHWEPRKPLVNIVAFILMDNHFHLLLQEIQDGGVASFMRKFGVSVTNRFNTRYKETGKLFQGSYKAKRITSDNYLRYASVYIQVKNALERFEGGLEGVLKNFEKAYSFAIKYPYSSLAVYADHAYSPIIGNPEMLFEAFPNAEELKGFAFNTIPSLAFNEKQCALTLQ